MQLRKFTTLMIVSWTLLSGCSLVDRWVYRPDINQGNYVTQEALDKLQIGQTKEQVTFIMGSPMLTSAFGDNTWYYVFRQQPQHGSVSQHTYIVLFDKTDHVIDIKTSELENSKSLEEMDKQGISDDISNLKDKTSGQQKPAAPSQSQQGQNKNSSSSRY
ncbi:outer membrane protein assembly factor BamE [Orbaceae bacterium ESL0727]|nr:outer membrane protein assembly factor BamE [Orbaceae bacterium ESL0727]